MRPAHLALLLGILTGLSLWAFSPAAAGPAAADEHALKAAHLTTTGPSLLDFFRKRTPPGGDRGQLAGLIKKLEDRTPATHEQAAGDLIAWGVAAVPLLRQAANNTDDTDFAARARQCLQLIEGPSGAGLVAGAARQVGALKPAGAAEVLLAYVPFADDDEVVREVQEALVAVGLRDGKPDDALLRALADPVPVRRAVAAEVVCRVGGPGCHADVRPLLKDPKPSVRLHAALGILGNHDAEALPVLIDLLADLPPGQRRLADDFLTRLAGEWALTVPAGNDAVSRRLRRDLWTAWSRATDGAQLLDEFRSRTLPDDERARVLGLIGKLGDDSAEAREKASADLVALGTKAVPLLRQAVSQAQARVGPLAEKCLQLIEKDTPTPLPAAAARLLALRRPEGSLEVLLAYLPFAENDATAVQVRDILAAVGFADGKPHEALVRALEDRVGARRAAAAFALCRGGGAGQAAAVRKLLADPEVEVRLQAALALAGVKDKEAVPVLIALLADLPLDQAWDVEDYLAGLAGDKAPQEVVTADPASRPKCRDAWTAWWREHGDKTDLTRAGQGPRELGHLLVVESFDPVKRAGRVLELDRAGKVRWQIEGLQFPQEAQVLPGDRVLIAEQNVNRVSERDLAGKILWERQLATPFACQRLRNGNTFLAGRNQLLEVDRTGKEVFTHHRPNDTILAARKFRDGQVAFVTYQGQYVRLDAAGKEARTFRVPFNPNFGVGGGEVLPGDRVLITTPNNNKVAEYDADGKTVWEATVPFGSIPHRLANGHTLVPCQSNTRIMELDRAGKVVEEMKELPYRPWKVIRR